MAVSSSRAVLAPIVATAFFMQLLDSSIVLTSLPQMAQSFGVTPIEISVGITAYLLTTAAFLPLSGWLADRWGARTVFAGAIVVFCLASLACGLAGTLTEFTMARAVQGVGGALMTPVGRMIVLRNTEKSDLLTAIAVITWPGLAAPVIGPALGGFITTAASWHWNFLLNVPLGAIGVVLVLAFVPNDRAETPQPFDGMGFLLSGTALACLLQGLESFAHDSAARWVSALLVAVGLAAAVAAVRHLNRVPHPLLDLSAMRVQSFAITTIGGGGIHRAVINATPFLLPLLYQIAFGFNAWEAGLMVLAYFAGNLGIKVVTTPVLRRWGFRSVLVVNGVLGGLTIAACALLAADTPMAVAVMLLVAAGATRSMQFTALNTLSFADISPAQRASSSTLSSVTIQVSMCVGVAAAAALLDAAQAFRGDGALVAGDFRFAFVAVGASGVLASLAFLRLPVDAGAEVSGHRPSVMVGKPAE